MCRSHARGHFGSSMSLRATLKDVTVAIAVIPLFAKRSNRRDDAKPAAGSDRAGCSSPRNSSRLRRVGAPRQRQRTPRTKSGSRGERENHPRIGLYNLGVRAAQGTTCARPRVWPENEERALAGRHSLIGSWRARFKHFMKELLRRRLLIKKVKSRRTRAPSTVSCLTSRVCPRRPTDAAAASPNFFHIDMDCFFVSVAVGGCRSEPVAVTS